MFAQVILDLPVEKSFHYKIPETLQTELKVGQWVEVPFNKRSCKGIVIGLQKEISDFAGETKEISGILAAGQQISEDLLNLTRWMAEYYCCSWGEALAAVVPWNVSARRRDDNRSALPCAHDTEKLESSPNTFFNLTVDQKASLERVVLALTQAKSEVFLLHGVTASGKTEIYFRAIEAAVALGKSAILLVPEIALTPQLVEWSRVRFSGNVAVLHSALSVSERRQEWIRIEQGSASVVIGARSAIFAPLRRLGIVIVDEEHEPAYKQEETPRYHARDAAIQRGRLNGAVVVLGSATPSLESYEKAKKGEFQLLSLPQRVEKRTLPEVFVVDMREEARENRRFSIFSRKLRFAIEEVIKAGEQGILFINRRGFAPFVQCQSCGTVAGCRSCSVGLSFHSRLQKLVCHYCGYQLTPPAVCPQCREPALRYLGIGTQKVESELVRLFPAVRVARLDSDTTRKRGAYEKIFSQFKKGQLDFLVGTQMVAKGFDFPRVTLVGVASADVTLHLTDFRSSERTFNLLTQVAGRSGRGERPGKVIIQTFSPEHYAIQMARSQDYEGFFEKEMRYRLETRFPPAVHLVDILFKGKDELKVVQTGKEIMERLKQNGGGVFEIIGLSPCPIPRIRDQYYWHLLLRGESPVRVSEMVRPILRARQKKRGVTVKVDVDPY